MQLQYNAREQICPWFLSFSSILFSTHLTH